MLDNSNKLDIINPVREVTDFLCLTKPQSRFGATYRYSSDNRNVAFLLERKMPKGIYKRTPEMKTGKHGGAFKIGHQPWNKGLRGLHFSQATEFKKGQFSLEKHPNWKGGIVLYHGYVRVRMPDHPFSDSRGYIRQHRLIIEKHIGRYLTPVETVHHIDGNKTNNSLNNLMLFISRSSHVRFEKYGIEKSEDIIFDGRLLCKDN